MPNLALLALEASDGTVVLTSITLVFAMLVALCLIITLEGKIFDNINNKKNGKPAAPKAPAAKAAPAPAAKPAAPAAKADNGSIPGEIIAAISAAVATVCGGNAVIRGIKRVSKAAPAPAAKPAAPAAKADNGGIPGEVIAAISAAVATVMGSGAVIHGIRRVSKPAAGSRRGSWGDAGVREHTTPFM